MSQLSSIKRFRCALILLLIPTGFLGCDDSREPPRVPSIRFTPEGVSAEADSSQGILRVAVRDAEDAVILDTGRFANPVQSRRIVFQWAERHPYTFDFELADGKTCEVCQSAPLYESFQPRLQLHLPYTGMDSIGDEERDSLHGETLRKDVWVVSGSRPELAMVIENTLDLPLKGEVTLTLPEGLTTNTGKSSQALRFTPLLQRRGERWHRHINLSVPLDTPRTWEIDAQAAWFQGEQSWRQHTRLTIRPRAPEDLAAEIHVRNVLFPCDSFGNVANGNRESTFVLPSRTFRWLWDRLGRREAPSNPWTPAGYESIDLDYKGKAEVVLIVESRVVDRVTGVSVPEMKPPTLLGGGKDRNFGIVVAKPGARNRVLLPLFVDTGRVLPGRYERHAKVRVWGAEAILAESVRPLEILRPASVSACVVMIALVTAIALLIVMVTRGNAILGRFTTHDLVMTALFATVLFSAVTLPMTLLSNVAVAVLGPFSFLITGLANEVAYYALLIAFLTLVPRTGAVAALILVRLLLSSVILGQITFPGLLFTATHIVLLEIVCFGTGLTRRRIGPGSDTATVLEDVATGRLRGLWWAAFWLGMADGLSSWVDFQLLSGLYRLYFADWYIALAVVVHGFTYTFAGVHLGARVGRSLGRTAP